MLGGHLLELLVCFQCHDGTDEGRVQAFPACAHERPPSRPGVVRLPIRGATERLGPPEKVVDLPGTVPDGVAFDAAGNLFISCYTPDIIFRFSPQGDLKVLTQDPLHVTLASPTNIAFCGEDRRTLVCANLGRWHLSKTQMVEPGAPLHYPMV